MGSRDRQTVIVALGLACPVVPGLMIVYVSAAVLASLQPPVLPMRMPIQFLRIHPRVSCKVIESLTVKQVLPNLYLRQLGHCVLGIGETYDIPHRVANQRTSAVVPGEYSLAADSGDRDEASILNCH